MSVLVSVLINNYNYSDYLEYCINSVLNQSYKNIEIIVYDDGSTDNSTIILEKFRDRIQSISKENYGKKPSLNQANAVYQSFLKSKGSIICLLDSDDAFKPDKVQKIVNEFESNQELVMIYNNFEKIDRDNLLLEQSRNGHLQQVTLKDYYKYNKTDFYPSTSSFSFRKSYLEERLPIDEYLYPDVWIDVRLSRLALIYGEVKYIPEILTEYRIHGANDSSYYRENKLKDIKRYIHIHKYVNTILKQKRHNKIRYFLSNILIKKIIKYIFRF